MLSKHISQLQTYLYVIKSNHVICSHSYEMELCGMVAVATED